LETHLKFGHCRAEQLTLSANFCHVRLKAGPYRDRTAKISCSTTALFAILHTSRALCSFIGDQNLLLQSYPIADITLNMSRKYFSSYIIKHLTNRKMFQ